MANYISRALTAFIIKRIRTFALTIALLLGMMPLTAFAATGNVDNWTGLMTAKGNMTLTEDFEITASKTRTNSSSRSVSAAY